MCSIVGGNRFDEFAFSVLERARDRGRDFTGLAQRAPFWIANHRATPTTEEAHPIDNQPLGNIVKIVHNGTIQNDKELGARPGEIDSAVLTRCLDFTSLETFRDTLLKIKGSYAIAAMLPNTIYLACNYKPIFYLQQGDKFYFSSLAHHLGIGAKRMRPYSVMDISTLETLSIPRTQANRALIICSGGLDSTSLTGYAKSMHDEIALLHFNYGCRAGAREFEAIKKIASFLKCSYHLVNMPYHDMHGDSPLLTKNAISQGKAGAEYAFEWVPARNLLFLSYAVAFAEANDFGHIYIGTNLEEAGAYPDNEEQFILDFNDCLYGAVQNGKKVEIHTPLGNLMKREIVEFGMRYDSPLHLSWSCYEGKDLHCGTCGPCTMRRIAFQRAGVKDPTFYEDMKDCVGS